MIDNKNIGKIMQKASSPIPTPSSASQNTTTPRQPSAPLSCSLPKEPSPLAQRFTEEGTSAPVPASPEGYNDATEEEPSPLAQRFTNGFFTSAPVPASPEGYNDATEEELIFPMDL